jgi:hypothetical protein
MAYSDFTADDLTARFGIAFQADYLIVSVPSIEPSPWLVEALELGRLLGFSTEKSRSERLVTPVLLELTRRNPHTFSIYSGSNLDGDLELGLRGECDFIFSLTRIQDFVRAPIFCITEAKKQDLESGTVQAAAQLLGARKLNERQGYHYKTLFGCATTGIEWRFLKLEDNLVTIDEHTYLINELPELLGILQAIVHKAVAQAKPDTRA